MIVLFVAEDLGVNKCHCSSERELREFQSLLINCRMDTDVDAVPEDGEIVDYEPLVRPSVNTSLANNSFRLSTRSCTSDSSESNDSDNGKVSRKKQKPQKKKDSGRNSKYNVWASEFQTSELMDEISGWETGLKNRVMDKSRSVESYYHLPEEKEEEYELPKHSDGGAMRKRRFGEVVDLRSKLGERQNKQISDSKSHPRYLSEIRVTVEDTIEDVTQDITLKLCEEKEDLVLRVVTVLGKEKAIDLFNRTRDVEKDGGMMVMNGSRRRTPGGVFLQLLKKDDEISRDQRNKIFIDDQKTGNKSKKSKSKFKPKKDTELCTSMQIDSNEEQNLPVLMERKDLVLSSVESEINEKPVTPNTTKTTGTGEEQTNTRQLAVYDDIFDDNPYDIEFT